MPKFLDVPSWYDATGAALYGIGSSSALGAGVLYHGPAAAQSVAVLTGNNTAQILGWNGNVPYWKIPYLHCITLRGSGGSASVNVSVVAALTILNFSSTAFTLATLSSYLYDKGFTSSSVLYPASGDGKYVNTSEGIDEHTGVYGAYATTRNSRPMVIFGVSEGSSSSAFGLNDEVIALS